MQRQAVSFYAVKVSGVTTLANERACRSPSRAVVAQRCEWAQNDISLRGLHAPPSLDCIVRLGIGITHFDSSRDNVILRRNLGFKDGYNAPDWEASDWSGRHGLRCSKLTSTVPHHSVGLVKVVGVLLR